MSLHNSEVRLQQPTFYLSFLENIDYLQANALPHPLVPYHLLEISISLKAMESAS